MRAVALLILLLAAAGPGAAQTDRTDATGRREAEATAAFQPEPDEEDAAAEAAAPPEQVVATLSQNQVSLTTTYSGSEIFVFGAVKREAPPPPGRFDVIIAVAGPSEPVIVRRKARTAGIWANRDEIRIAAAPSFYAVAATAPLDAAVDVEEDRRLRISLDEHIRAVGLGERLTPEDRAAFREALIRLRSAEGLYAQDRAPVDLQEDALFAARFALPANIVEGDYRARVFLLRDGMVTDEHESVIAVRKAGLERWLFSLSREAPLAYGLLSIFVALSAGWGASEAFRLLRR